MHYSTHWVLQCQHAWISQFHQGAGCHGARRRVHPGRRHLQSSLFTRHRHINSLIGILPGFTGNLGNYNFEIPPLDLRFFVIKEASTKVDIAPIEPSFVKEMFIKDSKFVAVIAMILIILLSVLVIKFFNRRNK